jgi:uncharacterized Zn finger protein
VPVVWFDDNDLRRLAGPKSYERGRGYLRQVGDVDELPGGVVAMVYGTETYEVRLRRRAGGLDGECTCPYGQDGAFCKHCVAVGLTLLADTPAAPKASKARRRKPAAADLRSYLALVEPAELIDLLLELAADDPALHRRLSLRAATHGAPDTAQLRLLIDSLRVRGYLDYARSFDYARKANDVLDALDRVTATQPILGGPLYRRAIRHLTATTEQGDDSSGVIGDALDRAVDGYAAACRAAPPDPVELATWIIDTQVDGPGRPEIPIADFTDALGETGLAAYRRRLADLSDSDTAWHLREEYLKTIAGDTDALVAHYADDLPLAYRYVQIGETLRETGRHDDAIAWLRRGIAEADRPDSRIGALLADLLIATGRHEEAVEARWELFIARPDVDTHRLLLDAADRAGALTATADRAAAHLRERATRGGAHADPLVAVLLAAGDIGAAWAAASEYRCSPGLRFTVAARRAETHPADAVEVYAARVDDLIDRKHKAAYADAARVLTDLRDLHRRAGTDFAGYLAALKETHRRKSAFLAELTRACL